MKPFPCRTAIAAAVPTACPTTAQVAITRAALIAACVRLMWRPANKRFSMEPWKSNLNKTMSRKEMRQN